MPGINHRCDHCGSANTLVPDEDNDLCCWLCGYTHVRVPGYVMSIFTQRIGRESLLREPNYRGIEL